MTQEQVIRSRIHEILGRHPWHDICPLEQAVEGAMTFRRTLCGAALQLFDDLMMEGVLPENAAQSVEFAINQGLLSNKDEIERYGIERVLS